MPRPALPDFMTEAREALTRLGAEVIYGTVRLIERDAPGVVLLDDEAPDAAGRAPPLRPTLGFGGEVGGALGAISGERVG